MARDGTQAVLVSAKGTTKSGSNQGAMSPLSVFYLNTEGVCQSCQKNLEKVSSSFGGSQIGLLFSKGPC